MLKAYHSQGLIEAGCDEAGRGCLAGPVVAAAVILPPHFQHPLLNDSKRLSAHRRHMLRGVIQAQAISVGLAMVMPREVDCLNVLNAALEAMHRAIAALSRQPQLILVDGNRFKPYGGIPHRCVVRGDATYASIAAASVLAKTHRDEYMQALARSHPGYGWERNAGYPTAAHRAAIARLGITPHHRRSFRLTDTQRVIAFPPNPITAPMG